MMRVCSLLLCSFLLFGCITSEARNQEKEETPYHQKPSAPQSKEEAAGFQIDHSWQYRIEITHEGSRSEGKIGMLLYRSEPVGWFFDLVVLDGRYFEYKRQKHLWDFGGYREVTGSHIPRRTVSGEDETTPSAEDLKQGWFESGLAENRPPVPESWIWVNRGNRSWYLDPEFLETFLDSTELEERSPRPELQTYR